MGRELCISLTAVVLEAINTVEQAQLQSHSSESQQKPLQLNDPNDQSVTQPQPQLQPRPQRAVTAEKRRPSSERFSRDAIAAESMKVGARARAGSECNGKPQRRGAAGDRGAAVEGTLHKEDPGLKDLDKREEEFRKVRCQRRCRYVDRGVAEWCPQPGGCARAFSRARALARTGNVQEVVLLISCRAFSRARARGLARTGNVQELVLLISCSGI